MNKITQLKFETKMKIALVLIGLYGFYQYGVARNEDYVWGGILLGAIITIILMEKYNRFLERQNEESCPCSNKEIGIFLLSQIIVGFVLTFFVFSAMIMLSGILQVDDRFLTETYPVNFWLMIVFILIMIVDSIITLTQLKK